MVQVFAQKVQGVDFTALEAVIAPVLRAHRVQVAEIYASDGAAGLGSPGDGRGARRRRTGR